jgi:Ca-activated chloride channel family protein
MVYLQAPLTFDRATVSTLLDEAVIGLAGQETAIGDAIALGVKRLREQPQGNRMLILLTDGANTAGNIAPLKAAELAKDEGVRIYTIGVGADQQVRGLFGQTLNMGSDLDEASLQKIASLTGGEYFRARDLPALQAIYQQLDQLEPLAKDTLYFRDIHEWFGLPLSLALLLSALLGLLASGWLPRLPLKPENPATLGQEVQHV